MQRGRALRLWVWSECGGLKFLALILTPFHCIQPYQLLLPLLIRLRQLLRSKQLIHQRLLYRLLQETREVLVVFFLVSSQTTVQVKLDEEGFGGVPVLSKLFQFDLVRLLLRRITKGYDHLLGEGCPVLPLWRHSLLSLCVIHCSVNLVLGP